MCGGWACNCAKPKHFMEYNGTPIVQRTIDLLRYYHVKDIAITTSPSKVDMYKQFDVEVIPHEANNVPFVWLDAFYFTDEPVCYMFGDVVYSIKAIKTIVETKTTDIEFFASAPPFAPDYPKKWAEPFAFKVANTKKFRQAVLQAKDLKDAHIWYRDPISWELWQVIKGTTPNMINYSNYVVINDFTCDIDCEAEIDQWQRK